MAVSRTNRSHFLAGPGHGEPLPTGHFFYHGLRPQLVGLMHVAKRQIAGGHQINFAAHLPALQQWAFENYWHYWREGLRLAAEDILAAALGKRGGYVSPLRGKSLSVWGGYVSPLRKNLYHSKVAALDFSFNLLRAEVIQSLQSAAFAFAQSTLETAQTDARKAVQAAREALRQGITRGESTRKLNARMVQIFNDPHKAARVAQTEASRAFGMGQVEAAKKSDVVTALEWLASSDSCDKCSSINRKRVRPGEPFYVHQGGKPEYQYVYSPPLHPHCMCTVKSVVDPNALTDQNLATLQFMAHGVPSTATSTGAVVF